jgi:hypothetical protein
MADVKHMLSQIADEFDALQAQLDAKQTEGDGGRMSGEEISAAQDAELAAAAEPVVEAVGQDVHGDATLGDNPGENLDEVLAAPADVVPAEDPQA